MYCDDSMVPFVLMQMLGAYWLVTLGVAALQILGRWKLFEKAGKHGWAAIIPFYNLYTEYEIAMGDGIKFLWLYVPFVNIYFAIKVCFDLAKAYGKDIGYGFGLLFLPEIFYPVLGLGKAEYVGPEGNPVVKNAEYHEAKEETEEKTEE